MKALEQPVTKFMQAILVGKENEGAAGKFLLLGLLS